MHCSKLGVRKGYPLSVEGTVFIRISFNLELAPTPNKHPS